MKYYRKRLYKKRSTIKTRSIRNVLVPDRFFVKLKYRAQGQLTSDANGVVTVNFVGNGPFNTDLGGDQPTGWDQYTSLYRFYYCAGSKMTLEMVNTESDRTWTAGLFPATNQLANGDMASVAPADYPYCTEVLIGQQATSRSYHRWNKYMSTKKIYGYNTAGNSNFIASIAANPTNAWYWCFYVSTAGTTPAMGEIMMYRCTITYYINFFGRAELTVS